MALFLIPCGAFFDTTWLIFISNTNHHDQKIEITEIKLRFVAASVVRGKIIISFSPYYQSKLHSRAVIVIMELIFHNSAFKHNLTDADIRHAFETCCYIDQYKNRENVYLLLGFDTNANPVEILYNLEDNGINVFHAMSCRKQFFHLFKREEIL